MKNLYLIDVSSMFFRAYYAIRPLTSPSGVPVNAIYGFLSMLAKLMKSEKPEYLVFCYDRKEPSFRHELYDAYKANRSEMPEDLAQQIPYIKKLAELMGVPALEVDRFEADDLIGTLAVRGEKAGFNVFIVSGDKDFAQLVSDRITLYDTMKEVRYGPDGVVEKWGIRPEQMIDYLAIVGDSSDNVPGVRGIGEKGALKLLQEFSSLEEIYRRIDDVGPKGIKQKLIDSQDQAKLSKKLVTIVTDVDVPEDFDHYRLKEVKREELRSLLRELNFKTLERTLLGDDAGGEASAELTVAPGAEGPSKSDTSARPATEISVEALVTRLGQRPRVWVQQDPRGLFVSADGENFRVLDDSTKLGPLADEAGWSWSGYDLKTIWRRIGCERPTLDWDGALAAYVVHAGDVSDQRKIFEEHLGRRLPDLPEAFHWFAAHLEFKSVMNEKMKDRGLEKIYAEIEAPLVEILLRMERRGILLDRELLAVESSALETEALTLEKEIHELAGESFNVGSPKQLSVVLFEKLGLQTGRKTKTGFSTDSDVLEKLDHPIAAKVLSWRELVKLRSTYVDALPQMVGEDGRVHTSFNQILTATGRLSSNGPNLQNIPIRTERGQRVRRAFIAERGRKLLSVDYSQIELRILAHISGDPGLCKAFADDLDIHAATAAEIFSVHLKDVTSEQRRAAKAVNFGIAYGQEAFGLAENLGVSHSEAKGIINRYFEKFAGVRSYIDETTRLAHERGYVETLFGRRRYIDELKSKNPALRKFGERAAINAPIQGTASDLVKKAMIEVDKKVKSQMLLQVHDELVFEAEEDLLKSEIPLIRSLMEGVMPLQVPLKVNAAIGDNWDQAHG